MQAWSPSYVRKEFPYGTHVAASCDLTMMCRCQIGSSSLSHKLVLNYAICVRRAGTAVCLNTDTITCRIAYDLQGIILPFTGNIYSCIILNFFPKIGVKLSHPFSGNLASEKVILFVWFILRRQDDVQTNQIIKINKCGTRGYLLHLIFLSQATPACVWSTCWQAGRLPLGGTESNRFWARETICVSRINSLSVLTTVALNRLALTSSLKPHWWIELVDYCELLWFSQLGFMEKTIF